MPCCAALSDWLIQTTVAVRTNAGPRFSGPGMSEFRQVRTSRLSAVKAGKAREPVTEYGFLCEGMVHSIVEFLDSQV